MSTTFNQCPNCRRRPERGFFGAPSLTIFECKECETLYCYKCGDARCPNCGGKRRFEAGKCYAK